MRKYTKVERVIIAMTWPNYNTYDCITCGVFSTPKPLNICPSCKKEGIEIENFGELKNKFKSDLL